MSERYKFIAQPGGSRLGDLLKTLLADEFWSHFSAAVAFVKRSGVQYIAEALRAFSARSTVKMLIGVDLSGSSREGLADLLACVGERGEIWVCHNESVSTFHPKVYVFRNEAQAVVVIGSGNLTEGGLFTNYEASIMRILDLTLDEDAKFLVEIDAAFEEWISKPAGISHRLTAEFLKDLYLQGYVVDEHRTRGEEKTAEAEGEISRKPKLFATARVPRPPSISKSISRVKALPSKGKRPMPAIAEQKGKYIGFVMTLQRTDAGKGQITVGTARRSPEIFIPLAARNYNPSFWGWPDKFQEDPKKIGKYDRRNVPMELAGQIILVNMMTWPAKHDFRLRSEALRSAGNIGDILKIEIISNKKIFYRASVISRRSPDYGKHLRLCSHSTPNSKKRWGYF